MASTANTGTTRVSAKKVVTRVVTSRTMVTNGVIVVTRVGTNLTLVTKGINVVTRVGTNPIMVTNGLNLLIRKASVRLESSELFLKQLVLFFLRLSTISRGVNFTKTISILISKRFSYPALNFPVFLFIWIIIYAASYLFSDADYCLSSMTLEEL